MAKLVRLTESDLIRLTKKIIKEGDDESKKLNSLKHDVKTLLTRKFATIDTSKGEWKHGSRDFTLTEILDDLERIVSKYR
jgi:hypothetical protein